MAEYGPLTVTLRDGAPAELRHALPQEASAGGEYLRELYGRTAEYLITQGAEYDPGDPEYPRRLGSTLDDPRSVHVYAWSDGRVIGDAMFKGGAKARDRHTGWFGVGVHPDWQGRGLGRILTGAILDWAAAHEEIERVTLRVFAANARAIALYRSLGFIETDRALRAFKLEDGSYADDLGMAVYVKPGAAPGGFGEYRSELVGTPGEKSGAAAQRPAAAPARDE